MTKILIIYTGGTIGMVNDPQSGVLIPFDFTQISENVPELRRLGYQIHVHSFEPVIDSSNMNPEIWKELAVLISTNYDAFDGFVILHGSDTMAYSASALSFMLQNLAKPVIFTGSQLPIGEIRTDAKENLITALEIAAMRNSANEAMVPEVCIYFDYQLLRGNRAIKYSSEAFEAFRSPNYPALAEAGVNLKFFERYIARPANKNLELFTHFNPNIGVLKLYPGISESVVRSVTESTVDAIIVEAFGSGNATTEDWFLKALEAGVNNGKIIVDISQCSRGSVQLGKYETSRQLKQIGVLSGFDMTFEATISKLMYLLGCDMTTDERKRRIQENLNGELTVK